MSLNKSRVRHKQLRLGLLIPTSILVLLILALLLNAVIQANQTTAAHITVPGAKLVQTPQGTLQVLDQGDRQAPAIVLIHGFASSLRWWDTVVPLLTPHYRVIRMDLLGDGGSEDPTSGHYTVENQAAAVGNMLQQLRIAQATIVGHSLGGAVATSLAEQFPNEVARLVILDTSAHANNVSLGTIATATTYPIIGPALKSLLNLFGKSQMYSVGFAPGFKVASGFTNPNQVEDDVRAMTYTSFRENQLSFATFTNAEPLEQRLTRIDKPLLVIFGAKDLIAIHEANDLSAYRSVPGAQVVILPGVGHSPEVEAPNKTASLILAFVTQA